MSFRPRKNIRVGLWYMLGDEVKYLVGLIRTMASKRLKNAARGGLISGRGQPCSPNPIEELEANLQVGDNLCVLRADMIRDSIEAGVAA